jgi:hypothetical protein
MAIVFIGIDDTDNQTSMGTGRLARLLAAECARRGMKLRGVTRHQFLQDPAIPFTSHNSGACIALETGNGISAVEFGFEYVRERAAEGSDPGVCLAEAKQVTPEMEQFGQAATTRIVEMREAYAVAEKAGVELRGLGGDNLGVIGALGSVGLRAEGNEGRYIDLPGLRELPDRVKSETFHCMGIEFHYKIGERQPRPADFYETRGWVRPRLENGKPVLWVEWSKADYAWIPVDRKKRRVEA